MTLPVALDAMGGDAAPEAIVAGAIDAARLDGRQVLLCGREDVLRPLLAGVDVPAGSLAVEHWPDVVEMGTKPNRAMRQKDSSMAGVFRAVKEGRAGAAVSAGNSGATLALGLRYLGRIPGVQRPAISLMSPGTGGLSVFLDGGANTACTAQMLGQFGVMGSLYAEAVLGLQAPRVGLLSNGSEEGKGTDLTRATFPLLEAAAIRFEGYCEGTDLFGAEFDVFVTDGFTGNVALKTLEGTARFVGREMKRLIEQSWWRKLGAVFARGAFRDLKVVLDPRNYGGAPLLGLNGVAIIAHGSSDALAVRSALGVGDRCMALDLSARIEAAIAAFNALPAVVESAG